MCKLYFLFTYTEEIFSYVNWKIHLLHSMHFGFFCSVKFATSLLTSLTKQKIDMPLVTTLSSNICCNHNKPKVKLAVKNLAGWMDGCLAINLYEKYYRV